MNCGAFCYMASIFLTLGLFTIVQNLVRCISGSGAALAVRQIYCMILLTLDNLGGARRGYGPIFRFRSRFFPKSDRLLMTGKQGGYYEEAENEKYRRDSYGSAHVRLCHHG